MKKNFTQCLKKFIIHCLFSKQAMSVLTLFTLCLQLLPAKAGSLNSGNILTAQQTLIVSGTVVDDQKADPIPGVVIYDSNKKTLAVTGANGEFTIKIEKGKEISFSLIGYTAFKMTVTENNNNLKVRLTEATTDLNEVVVTALGIKREEKSLGYSATSVKGEQLTNAISGNWTDALSGKVAGLNLVRSNSGPTGSNKIILRGENNLTGDNEALFVVL
jgi:hypothetical protein